MLATFGVVCHAQMTLQDASGVTSCEAELASCQVVLGAFGTKKAEDVVPLAAVTAEQYPESNAPSCAAMLRDCQAHSSARMGATSGGDPGRLMAPSSLHAHIYIYIYTYIYIYIYI